MNKISPRKKIGLQDIHAESEAAAIEIAKILNEGLYTPLLVSQPQQGKTQTMTAVVDQFIRNCIANNQLWQVIIVSMANDDDDDDDVKNQIKDRFYAAGLNYSQLTVEHLGGLKSIKINPLVQKRLIILDECHIGIGKDRKLDGWLRINFGINYNKLPATWQDKSTQILSVSATPYTQNILANCGGVNKIFELIILKAGNDYYSMKHMIETNRLNNSFKMSNKLNGKNVISQDMKNCLAEFIENCVYKGIGYLIIRLHGDNYNTIKSYIDNILKIRNQTFSSSKSDTPNKEIDGVISSPPPEPMILIVKGALRCGKTFTTTQYIRGMVDSPNSKADTASQSFAGRCCGRLDARSHSKFSDTFPIYCNYQSIEEAVSYYDTMNNLIPNGNNNYSNAINVINCYEILFFDTKEETCAKAWHHYPNASKIGVGNISTNKVDMCAKILNLSKPSDNTVGWLIDKPNNPSQQESFDKLLKIYPNAQGRYALIVPKNNHSIPSGNNNSSNVINLKHNIEYMVFETETEALAAAKIKYGDTSDWHGHQQHPGTISGNKETDAADAFLKRSSFTCSRSRVIWNIDESNPNFEDSWKKLMNEYPNWENKWVVSFDDGQVINTVPTDKNLIKQ